MSRQRYPIGIDLGTTFSSLAYVDDKGRLEALRLPTGRFAMASAVYFQSEDEVVVGDEALEFALIHSDRVARAFKRQMGDPVYQVETENGLAPFTANGRTHRPEELSALVLKKLLSMAEARLGPIDEAVITVPYVFDEKRRRATQDAARIAGLSKVDLVDEPVAAALAYANKLFAGGGLFGDELLDQVFDDAYVLVYDLGGGTFDSTIMRLGTNGVFEVLATGGDERLGGVDWDDVLFRQLHAGLRDALHHDPPDDAEFLQELRLKTVQAKESLSERARVEVRVVCEGREHTVPLTVGDFKREARPLVARTVDTLNEMFLKTRLSWSHVEHLLLVGGASRMPMIRETLTTITGRALDMSLSPDTAIAMGAALYAAFRAGDRPMKLKDVKTVNSHALGLKVKDPADRKLKNDVLLASNKPTRTAVKRAYDVQDPRKPVSLVVLLGEFPDPNACVELGSLQVKPLAGLARQTIEVSFSFQANGLLLVEAWIRTGQGQRRTPARLELAVQGRMSEGDVETAAQTLRGISIE